MDAADKVIAEVSAELSAEGVKFTGQPTKKRGRKKDLGAAYDFPPEAWEAGNKAKKRPGRPKKSAASAAPFEAKPSKGKKVKNDIVGETLKNVAAQKPKRMYTAEECADNKKSSTGKGRPHKAHTQAEVRQKFGAAEKKVKKTVDSVFDSLYASVGKLPSKRAYCK